MSDARSTHVISADRLDGSLIITFENGRCAIYSSDLLYATLPAAKEIYEEDAEEQAVKKQTESHT